MDAQSYGVTIGVYDDTTVRGDHNAVDWISRIAFRGCCAIQTSGTAAPSLLADRA